MDKKQLKKIRYQTGLNTKDFGKKIGYSGRTIENWEQGRYIPKSAKKLIEMVYCKKKQNQGAL